MAGLSNDNGSYGTLVDFGLDIFAFCTAALNDKSSL